MCWWECFPAPVLCTHPPLGLLQQQGSTGTNLALHRMLVWEAGRALRSAHPNAWSTLVLPFLAQRPGRVGAEDAQDVPRPTPATGARLNTPLQPSFCISSGQRRRILYGEASQRARQRLHRSSQECGKIKISHRKNPASDLAAVQNWHRW